MTVVTALTDGLVYRELPDMALPTTDGRSVSLARLDGVTVVNACPGTVPPLRSAIPGWEQISAARVCTPLSFGFRGHHPALQAADSDAVPGFSVQDTDRRREIVERLCLSFPLVPDAQLALQGAIGLSGLETDDMILLERIATVCKDGRFARDFHHVDAPGRNARDVLTRQRDCT